MLFTIDSQTMDDLHIFGRTGSDSVYGLFNRTVTRGGADLLQDMFRYPLSEEPAINRRSGIIRYFAVLRIGFPFKTEHFDAIEPYLDNTDERTKLLPKDYSLAKKLSNLIGVDAETAWIYKGVTALMDLLKELAHFLHSLDEQTAVSSNSAAACFYQSDREALAAILAEPAFEMVLRKEHDGNLSHTVMAAYDLLFRFRYRESISKLLRSLYFLDVYLAVAKVALEKGFVFPQALPGRYLLLHAEGVYHPQLKKPVPNTIHMEAGKNVLFLTGANMAGKSTFMKALGINLFLAHMGFPVAAEKMEFSVLDGIYTTINLPDNLGMGASHFYAEVLRVKKIARELGQSKRLFVVFDELFRGTNVKDAYEATVALTAAFATKGSSFFIISTHIIEAGEVLRERKNSIRFVYLPTRMNGSIPEYTYTLQEGITEDRHGMVIIRNEGILDILENGKGQTDKTKKV